MDAFSVQIKPIYTTGKCAGVVAFAFLLFATGPGGGISRVSADAPIQASQPAISLQQAIAERRVRAYAEPSAYGLQQKPMMHLVVIGGDSTSLVLYVAQGTTFSPPNSAYAPVVLTTGVTFTLNSPGPVNLWTLSLLHDRNSPSVFAPISYTVGAILTESHLTRVLAAWETNPMTSVVAAQLAVWSAYEGLPLSQLAGTLGSQVTQRDVDIAASLLSGQLKSSDPPASPTPLETVPAVTLSPASTPSSTPVIGNGTITNAPKDSVVAWVVLGILIGITGAVLVAAITISLRRRNTAAVSHHVTAPPSRAQNEKTTPDSSEMQKQVEDTTTVIRPVYQLVSRAGSLITQIIAVERELMISRADVSWIIIPDSAISAPQAAIDLGEPHRVKDLNSRNKTACGDKDTTTFVTIAEGEFIRVNTLTLHVTNKRIDVVTGGDPLQEKTWTSEIDFAVLSHHNINSDLFSCIRILNWRSSDKIIGNLPIFHSFGLIACFWLPIVYGAEVVYIANPLDAQAIGQAVRNNKLTLMLATPGFLQTYMRRCEATDFASVRLVISGAEKLRNDIADKFQAMTGLAIAEGYGCSELSPVVSINVASSILDLGTSAGKRGSIGAPMPGVCVKIVDPDTFELKPPDTDGLLIVKGPTVMQGYLNDPVKTAEVIRDGWYLTGDIARMSDRGYITVTGRLSRFSKIAGEMVPHELVEKEINEIIRSETRCIAVCGVEDSKKGEKLVVIYSDRTVDPQAVVKELRARDLPNLWIPRPDNFYFIQEIPMLGSGKLDFTELKKAAAKLAAESNNAGASLEITG